MSESEPSTEATTNPASDSTEASNSSIPLKAKYGEAAEAPATPAEPPAQMAEGQSKIEPTTRQSVYALRRHTVTRTGRYQDVVSGPSMIIATMAALAAIWWIASGKMEVHEQKPALAELPHTSTAPVVSAVQPKTIPLTSPDSRSIPKSPATVKPNAKRVTSAPKEEALAAAKSQTMMTEINAADLKTLTEKGYGAMRRGDNDYAILALSRAVKLNPNSGLIRQYLSYALIGADQPVAALSQFMAFKKIQGAGLSDQLTFATRLAESSDKTAAERLFDQMINESAQDFPSLELIAEKAETLGFVQQASNAALLGMKSRLPEQQNEFRRLYEKLQHQPGENKAKPSGPLPHYT